MAKTPIRRRIRKVLRSPKLLLITATLTILATTLLFANKGLWRHIVLRHDIAKEREHDAELTKEEGELTKRVDLLKKEDPATIERVAREKYSMKKPGEVV